MHFGNDGYTQPLRTEKLSDRRIPMADDYVKAVHDAGILAGVSAHNPDCIQRIADEGWDVDFSMTCFYCLTRKVAKGDPGLPTLEIACPFYKDDPKTMTQVVRQIKQPCRSFKILGAGRRWSGLRKSRSWCGPTHLALPSACSARACSAGEAFSCAK